jgi:nucleotide-binding universal stress UspA family protein
MPIKTILTPMTGAKTDGPALEAALSVADLTNAHIQAVFYSSDPNNIALPQLGVGMAPGTLGTLISAAERRVENDRVTARSSYEGWRRTNGISEFEGPARPNEITTNFAEMRGEVSTTLAKTGRVADVICMVQTSETKDGQHSAMVAAALFETGKMVYLAPNGKRVGSIKSIAIGWNGSREAARAVALAMPLLESAETVTVLAGTSDKLTPSDVDAFVTSLKWHGVNVQPRMFVMNGDQVGRLQAEAMDAGAQILVLGAYSHSRMREFVFGGVTDEIIKGARMLVLMAH